MVKIVKGGFVINLIDFFFLVLIINSFIFFYSIYLFFDNKVFKNQQGYKLNLKKRIINIKKKNIYKEKKVI